MPNPDTHQQSSQSTRPINTNATQHQASIVFLELFTASGSVLIVGCDLRRARRGALRPAFVGWYIRITGDSDATKVWTLPITSVHETTSQSLVSRWM